MTSKGSDTVNSGTSNEIGGRRKTKDPNNNAPEDSTRQSIVCYNCQGLGHIAKDCRQKGRTSGRGGKAKAEHKSAKIRKGNRQAKSNELTAASISETLKAAEGNEDALREELEETKEALEEALGKGSGNSDEAAREAEAKIKADQEIEKLESKLRDRYNMDTSQLSFTWYEPSDRPNGWFFAGVMLLAFFELFVGFSHTVTPSVLSSSLAMTFAICAVAYTLDYLASRNDSCRDRWFVSRDRCTMRALPKGGYLSPFEAKDNRPEKFKKCDNKMLAPLLWKFEFTRERGPLLVSVTIRKLVSLELLYQLCTINNANCLIDSRTAMEKIVYSAAATQFVNIPKQMVTVDVREGLLDGNTNARFWETFLNQRGSADEFGEYPGAIGHYSTSGWRILSWIFTDILMWLRGDFDSTTLSRDVYQDSCDTAYAYFMSYREKNRFFPFPSRQGQRIG